MHFIHFMKQRAKVVYGALRLQPALGASLTADQVAVTSNVAIDNGPGCPARRPFQPRRQRLYDRSVCAKEHMMHAQRDYPRYGMALDRHDGVGIVGNDEIQPQTGPVFQFPVKRSRVTKSEF
jgi:hypothetical protein